MILNGLWNFENIVESEKIIVSVEICASVSTTVAKGGMTFVRGASGGDGRGCRINDRIAHRAETRAVNF